MSVNRSNANDSSEDENASASALLVPTAGQDISKQKIANRAENICGHCMKKCTKTGRSSSAMRCDYCHYWYHAECEGLTSEQYQSLSQLAKVLPNLNYYCVFGHCKQVSDEMLELFSINVTK